MRTAGVLWSADLQASRTCGMTRPEAAVERRLLSGPCSQALTGVFLSGAGGDADCEAQTGLQRFEDFGPSTIPFVQTVFKQRYAGRTNQH